MDSLPHTDTLPALCPAQHHAKEKLKALLPLGHVFGLTCGDGLGRTTLLKHLHRELGGTFLSIRDFLATLPGKHPLALEEAFGQLVQTELRRAETVLVDDLGFLLQVMDGCGTGYPRPRWNSAIFQALADTARDRGAKLIFTANYTPEPYYRCGWSVGIGELTVEDYAFLCRAGLGERTESLDVTKIHRFAPELTVQQLMAACRVLAARPQPPDTASFIEYLRTEHLHSNVDLREVQAVDLGDLIGVDEVIRSLETHLVLPLENDALATELNLKPKRGVLLAGPPGTGKTTVGRALAHRLKSKFFLLDGTFIAGSDSFYTQVHRLIHEAKRNAPAILFIDDGDVLFAQEEGAGLYRYLLTLLDGLESETAGRICVMMTVMDVGVLPPALVRSGRIELWLEMRLPDEAARCIILQQHTRKLPADLTPTDFTPVATATNGFTGADLKRLVEDAKALYAFDRAHQQPLHPATQYFLLAADHVRANKELYAAAEARHRKLV
jgi:ATP-dependent 26S proteasome regulatory subunit